MTIPLAQALSVASRLVYDLQDTCERLEIAGSIRRRKEMVKDIELVVIPKEEIQGLLAEPGRSQGFIRTVMMWEKVKGDAMGRYTQRRLPGGATLDLFVATPDNWGLILAIRTGSARFSHEVLAKAWVRAGYRSEGGVLMKNGTPTYVREERDLFSLLGIPWIEPEGRNL